MCVDFQNIRAAWSDIDDKGGSEQYFMQELDALGIPYTDCRIGYERGHPDFIVQYDADEIYVELKMPEDGLRGSQREWIRTHPQYNILILTLEGIGDRPPRQLPTEMRQTLPTDAHSLPVRRDCWSIFEESCGTYRCGKVVISTPAESCAGWSNFFYHADVDCNVDPANLWHTVVYVVYINDEKIEITFGDVTDFGCALIKYGCRKVETRHPDVLYRFRYFYHPDEFPLVTKKIEACIRIFKVLEEWDSPEYWDVRYNDPDPIIRERIWQQSCKNMSDRNGHKVWPAMWPVIEGKRGPAILRE